MESTIEGFGNPEWGLGRPFPAAMAWAAGLSKAGGAILVGAGRAVRWATLPLMVTMALAAITVHWENGWPAIAGSGTATVRRRGGFVQRLAEPYPGRYEYTEPGRPVALNNGIAFAATYAVMLLALFFLGGGRFVGIDYWLGRRFITYQAWRQSPC